MNKLGIFVAVLLVLGAVFAAPDVQWFSPTPANNSPYYPSVLTLNFTSNETFSNSGTFIEIDGQNFTCTPNAANTSCNYTVPYLQRKFNHSYNVTGYANISNVSVPTELRVVNYQGCGFVSKNETLVHTVGNLTETSTCLALNASGITLDGNGYYLGVENTTSGISASGLENITIKNIIVQGGTWGILLTAVNDSVVENVSVYGIAGSTDGIALIDSDRNNITGSTIMSYGYGLYATSNSDYNNISLNSVTQNVVGIFVSDIGNIIDSNTVFRNTGQGVILSSTQSTAIDRNTIDGNGYGVGAANANDSIFWRNHYYNNTNQDMYFVNTDNDSKIIILSYDAFDNPLGNWVNYTRIAMLDVMAYNDSYDIVWSSFGTIPSNLSVFAGKSIAIDKGVLSSTPVIDELVVFWNASESAAYNESLFQLWTDEFPGTFTLYGNQTLNTTTNLIQASDVNVTGWARYGILYYSGTTPTPTNSDALSQMITILILGIVLAVIVVVVPNAMGFSVDSGPVMILIGLATMVILVYNYIIGAI